MINLNGIVPVVPTPFTAREEIDEEALRQLIEFTIAAGMSCVCLPAYGSEFYKLSEKERLRVVEIAADQSRKRVAILAQSNHASAKVAGEIARSNGAVGADGISFALPRQFALPEADMMRHAERLCRSVELPVLLQDFNPGGVTVGPGFCGELRSRCGNFTAVKLEEPVMGPKVAAIREATQGKLGVLEGWGGIYMTELFDYGLSGLMPGTGLCDILDFIWQALAQERTEEAMTSFERVLPLISFSLQTFELYHFVEKRLLQKRGLLPNAVVRDAQWTPAPEVRNYTDRLIARVLDEAERVKGQQNPVPEASLNGLAASRL